MKDTTAVILFPEIEDGKPKGLDTIKSNAVEVIQDFGAKIAKSKELYGNMKIISLADKAGYEQIKTAHIAVKAITTEIEAKRKEVKAPVLELGEWIDTEAKRLKAEVSPLETHLQTERKKYEAEEERVKKEKQEAFDAKMRQRVKALEAVESVIDYPALVLMTDAHYEAHLKVETAKHEERQRAAAELARLQAEEAERKRLAEEAEAKARREESERLEAQRKAQEAEQARLAAERAEIEAARKALADMEAKRLADEKAAKDAEERKAREAVIAAEAAERARLEAEAKAKAEAERKEREIKEAEAKRVADEKAKAEKLAAIEAAKPDADKLRKFAESILIIPEPTLATAAGRESWKIITASMQSLDKLIRLEAEKLTK